MPPGTTSTSVPASGQCNRKAKRSQRQAPDFGTRFQHTVNASLLVVLRATDVWNKLYCRAGSHRLPAAVDEATASTADTQAEHPKATCTGALSLNQTLRKFRLAARLAGAPEIHQHKCGHGPRHRKHGKTEAWRNKLLTHDLWQVVGKQHARQQDITSAKR